MLVSVKVVSGRLVPPTLIEWKLITHPILHRQACTTLIIPEAAVFTSGKELCFREYNILDQRGLFFGVFFFFTAQVKYSPIRYASKFISPKVFVQSLQYYYLMLMQDSVSSMSRDSKFMYGPPTM